MSYSCLVSGHFCSRDNILLYPGYKGCLCFSSLILSLCLLSVLLSQCRGHTITGAGEVWKGPISPWKSRVSLLQGLMGWGLPTGAIHCLQKASCHLQFHGGFQWVSLAWAVLRGHVPQALATSVALSAGHVFVVLYHTWSHSATTAHSQNDENTHPVCLQEIATIYKMPDSWTLRFFCVSSQVGVCRMHGWYSAGSPL